MIYTIIEGLTKINRMESVIIDNRMEIKIAMSVCEVIFSYFCANTATPAPTGNADITSETIIHSGSMLNTYIIKMNVISGWNNNFKITIMAISDPLNVFFLVFENWPTKPNPIAKSAVAPEAFDSSSERVEIAVGSGIPNTATLIPKITEIVNGLVTTGLKILRIVGIIGCRSLSSIT